MAQQTAVALTGDDLTVGDVWDVAIGRIPVGLSDRSRDRMHAARELVERVAHGSSEHTYGVNTGFGRFVSRSIPDELTGELQLRLLRSHACGVGDPYPPEIVRSAMLLRANTLAKGHSGARIETVETLVECLNRGVLPVVPSRGSVGASGDLAPLAHLALPLVGEGEALVDGERLTGAEALARVELEPIVLEAKEGLSLINGTQFMASFAALGVVRARRLAKVADLACALSLEALQGSRASFLPQVHALRPLRGQADSAANVFAVAGGLRDPRVPPLVRQGAGRLLPALRRPGPRRLARPPRLRAGDRRDRAQRGHRQPARARGRRAARVERQLPRTAARVRARRPGDGGRPSWRASPSGGSSASSTRTSRTGCPRF